MVNMFENHAKYLRTRFIKLVSHFSTGFVTLCLEARTLKCYSMLHSEAGVYLIRIQITIYCWYLLDGRGHKTLLRTQSRL